LILKPFLTDSESFLKDSTQLLQIVTSIKIVKKINLCSCDFEPLYTNIELQNAINIIMDIIKDHLNSIYSHYYIWYERAIGNSFIE
jgi:hypothetical protein